MELDELKDLWKKSDARFKPKNPAELATILKGNKQSIIAKLKRSVWFELLFTFAAGVALLVYALTLPAGAIKWTTVSILLIFVAYCVYYIKKLRILNRFDPGNDNLRVNLEGLIDNLSSYLRFYKRSYTILYPVYFVLALLFGAIERGLDEFLVQLTKPRTLLYLALLGGIFYFASTWLVTWLLKKLYGNHLENLRGIHRELVGNEKQGQE